MRLTYPSPSPMPEPRPAGAPVEDQLVIASTRPRPGRMTIRFFGELDRLTVERFEAALDQAVRAVAVESAASGAGRGPAHEARVVCDLRGVDFLGVAAMTALLRIDATALTEHVRWAVLAGSRIRHVFEIAALDRTLPLTTTDPTDTPSDPSAWRAASRRPRGAS